MNERLCVLKTRFGNSGDDGRPGRAQIRCGPRAGWRDGSERPYRETDEFSTHYSRRHTSSEPDVSVVCIENLIRFDWVFACTATGALRCARDRLGALLCVASSLF